MMLSRSWMAGASSALRRSYFTSGFNRWAAVGSSWESSWTSQPTVHLGQRRFLNLHEYQSRQLLEKFGCRVQQGDVVGDRTEALSLLQSYQQNFPDSEVVVKAQIHAGGRGKGRFVEDAEQAGVIVSNNEPEKLADVAQNMIGKHLVTKQTTEEGQLCQKVLINVGLDFQAEDERYFSIVLDRANPDGPLLVCSAVGGMDIEEVAETDPDAITRVPLFLHKDIERSESLRAASGMFPEYAEGAAELENIADQVEGLVKLFKETEALQVEINPFARATDGNFYCVDAKLVFDDNATFRHQALGEMRDDTQDDPREVEAEKAGLSYIQMDGNIGCMVNGAGLAMATMDIIQMYKGSPANFLDVGGSATTDQVARAFRILTADGQVEAILVNIFGGIMKCDVIAQGIVEASQNVEIDIPIVVRLEGTNVEAGKQILQQADFDFITADDLDDAAQKAVAAIGA